MTAFIYKDRYRFEVRKTLNGYVVWITNLTTGYGCEADGKTCAMLEGDFCFPRQWKSYYNGNQRDEAHKALQQLASLNEMNTMQYQN